MGTDTVPEQACGTMELEKRRMLASLTYSQRKRIVLSRRLEREAMKKEKLKRCSRVCRGVKERISEPFCSNSMSGTQCESDETPSREPSLGKSQSQSELTDHSSVSPSLVSAPCLRALRACK